jgi:hypothetical protein
VEMQKIINKANMSVGKTLVLPASCKCGTSPSRTAVLQLLTLVAVVDCNNGPL